MYVAYHTLTCLTDCGMYVSCAIILWFLINVLHLLVSWDITWIVTVTAASRVDEVTTTTLTESPSVTLRESVANSKTASVH